ncbi:hypothetical protein OYE22_12405 [Streptomyces sp. 71268]|uniref:hypothetical protein n=1 Tax=Streptomyces sp. 71268 TaxID=3002640 RepID=UPI0023F99F11|nr:hypothetical protein [Streptomyces sp. 71268]WEV25908.1 hypothetical protein OYE22_12405 [Streptomyces sp. 71268]
MTKLLLSIHVLVAVMFIGPVTVAASLFPRFARQALLPAGAPGAAPAVGDAAGQAGATGESAVGEVAATGEGGREAAVAARTAESPAGGAEAGAASTADTVRSIASVMLLHRISRVYAVLSVAVPAFGLFTAQQMGVMGDAWLIASMVLTVVAAILLGIAVLGYQDAVVTLLDDEERDAGAMRAMAARLPKLGMVTGLFSLTWAVVVVLMVVRPGSTTGA